MRSAILKTLNCNVFEFELKKKRANTGVLQQEVHLNLQLNSNAITFE
jgi:hypothetical protein